MQGSRPAHLPAHSARAFPTTAPPGGAFPDRAVRRLFGRRGIAPSRPSGSQGHPAQPHDRCDWDRHLHSTKKPTTRPPSVLRAAALGGHHVTHAPSRHRRARRWLCGSIHLGPRRLRPLHSLAGRDFRSRAMAPWILWAAGLSFVEVPVLVLTVCFAPRTRPATIPPQQAHPCRCSLHMFGACAAGLAAAAVALRLAWLVADATNTPPLPASAWRCRNTRQRTSRGLCPVLHRPQPSPHRHHSAGRHALRPRRSFASAAHECRRRLRPCLPSGGGGGGGGGWGDDEGFDGWGNDSPTSGAGASKPAATFAVETPSGREAAEARAAGGGRGEEAGEGGERGGGECAEVRR